MTLLSDGMELLGMITVVVIIMFFVITTLDNHFNHGYIDGKLVKCIEWQKIMNLDSFFTNENNPHSCSKWENVNTLPIWQAK